MAYVQSVMVSDSSVVDNISATLTVAPGNTLVAIYSAQNGGITGSVSYTTGSGGKWTQIDYDSGIMGQCSGGWSYSANSLGGTVTVKAQFSATVWLIRIILIELSGIDTITPLSAHGAPVFNYGQPLPASNVLCPPSRSNVPEDIISFSLNELNCGGKYIAAPYTFIYSDNEMAVARATGSPTGSNLGAVFTYDFGNSNGTFIAAFRPKASVPFRRKLLTLTAPPSLTAMLTRLTPRRWRMKPPVSTQLQYGNPLLIGLKEGIFFNEGGGTPTNIATPTLLPSLFGTAPWVSGLVGTGIHSSDSTHQVRIANSSLNYAAGDFTFRAVFTPVTWTSGFTDTFVKGNEFRLFFDTSGNLSLAALGGTDGGSCSTGMAAGGTYDFVITRSGSTCTCYVNGVNKGTFTNGNTTLQSAIFQYCGDGNRGSQGDVNIYTHNFWTRALSPSEVEELYVNPYSLLRGAPRIKFGSTTASSGLITVTAIYSFLQEATAVLVLSALLIEAASVVLTLLLEQTSATPTLEFEMTQEEV